MRGARNTDGVQGTDIGRGNLRGIPRHQTHHEENRAHVENQHACDDRVRGTRHRPRRFGGLAGGDRDDFDAEVEAGGRHGSGQNGQQAVGSESAVRREIANARGDPRP